MAGTKTSTRPRSASFVKYRHFFGHTYYIVLFPPSHAKYPLGCVMLWCVLLKQAVHNERHRLVQFGGAAPNQANAQRGAPKKYEGRRVGIDFFGSPRGPPGDLRRAKDLVRKDVIRTVAFFAST